VAQQDNAPNKPVHLIYLVGAVLLFYLLQWSIDWVWGYFSTPPGDFQLSLIAAVGAITISVISYRNDRVYHLANEVATELKKVTWPTAKEVRSATTVVIVMALVSAVILFLFDLGWSSLTKQIYGS
jgi:preprotein translocase subunit SecE